MKYRRLQNTELELAAVILGTDYFGGAIAKETAYRNIDLYTELGGNILDTARLYCQGESEALIGRYLAERGLKNKILISTKAAHPPLGHMDRHRLTFGEIQKDADASLHALGVDAIDLLWLHRDDASVTAEEVVPAVNRLIKQGKVRYWGVSNWRGKRMEALCAFAEKEGLQPPVGGQIQWALARCRRMPDETLVHMNAEEYGYYKRYKKPVFAFASQAKGFFEKYHAGTLSEKARERYLCDENIAIYKTMRRLQAETGYSLTAMGLAYLLLQEDFDVFPIIGASRPEYISQAIEAFSVKPDAIRELLELKP